MLVRPLRGLCLLLVVTFVSPSSTLALDLSLSAEGGLETNPNQLASRHNPDSDLFTQVRLRLDHDFESGAFVGLRAETILFLDEEDADQDRDRISGGYRSTFTTDDREFDYKLALVRTTRDKTYVSRSTGEIAVDNGQPIPDRYDYEQTNFNASIAWRTANKTRMRVRFQRRQKDYDATPDLSNLDYEHNRIRFDVEFRLSEQNRLRAGFGLTERDYDDRRIDDENGNDIAGTDLEYDYTNFWVETYFRPDQARRISFRLSTQDRDDNGVGYKDTQYETISVGYRHMLEDGSRWQASWQYSDLVYENRAAADPLDEEGFDSTGHRLRLRHEQPVFGDESKTTRLLSIEYEDFDSSDSDYRYQDLILSAGLRIELF
ncbi:MAG: hypothetical protein KJP11_03585 [Gammaproteobacteria bacterium]|nr:hypothetical protein [Gammaproteobacteria bacterium]